MSFHRTSSFHPAEQWHAQPLRALPTPSVVIDRAVYVRNSARMLAAARKQGMQFRVHIKTHKTSEGTRIQLDPHGKGEPRTSRLIISTVEEGWMLVNTGTLRMYGVDTVLYSLPPAPNTLVRLATLRSAMAAQTCNLLLMVDLPAQITAIERLPHTDGRPWHVFIKVDAGYHRAGVPVRTRQFEETVQAVLEGAQTSLYGFYVHAGNSYSATSRDEANAYLHDEISAVTEASRLARGIIESNPALKPKYDDATFVLSVGATPTANAARVQSENGAGVASTENAGELELHAGNYSLYDLQQFATSMIDEDQIAVFVLSTVCSVYPGRNSDVGEALCDAGGLAMSKDRGPALGYGNVRSGPGQGLQGWYLGRIAQEHGVLTYSSPPVEGKRTGPARLPEYGEKLRILPQHACMTLANHPWYYVVDSSLEGEAHWADWTVRDVWTPAKFW